MVSPGEMVSAVARALGVPEITVVQHDRKLADVGLRAKGGRGPSAAKMTARDVANLLIGIAASSSIQETAANAREYGGLPLVDPLIDSLSMPKGKEAEFYGVEHPDWRDWPLCLPVLRELTPDHTFADALAALIQQVAEDAVIAEAMRKYYESLNENQYGFLVEQPSGSLNVEITIMAPWPDVRVDLYARPGDADGFIDSKHYEMRPPFGIDPEAPPTHDQLVEWHEAMRSKYGLRRAGLRQTRTIGTDVILAMGDLLRSDN